MSRPKFVNILSYMLIISKIKRYCFLNCLSQSLNLGFLLPSPKSFSPYQSQWSLKGHPWPTGCENPCCFEGSWNSRRQIIKERQLDSMQTQRGAKMTTSG